MTRAVLLSVSLSVLCVFAGISLALDTDSLTVTNEITQTSSSATNSFMGKVAVGKADADEQLDVLGNVKADGFIVGGRTSTNWNDVFWKTYTLYQTEYSNGLPYYAVPSSNTTCLRIPAHFQGPLTTSELLGKPGSDDMQFRGDESGNYDSIRRWNGAGWEAQVYYHTSGDPTSLVGHWVQSASNADDAAMFYGGDVVVIQPYAGCDTLRFKFLTDRTVYGDISMGSYTNK